jgi:hypothetical protein
MGAIAALVVVIGIVCVIYGFMERAKAQRVTSAPLLRTGEVEGQPGGAAVSVEGNVVCSQPLIAPFSGVPCLYYSIKATAEWKAGDTKKTKEISSTKMAAQFSVDDGSGPVAIDAREGGTFEPTQKKSETKGAGLVGGITGKELMFGQYVVSTGALGLGTSYRVDEEVLPVERRLYVCGAASNGAIAAPSGLRSLLVSHKSRGDLLGSALKTSKLALAGGFSGVLVGTIVGVISRLMAPDASAAADKHPTAILVPDPDAPSEPTAAAVMDTSGIAPPVEPASAPRATKSGHGASAHLKAK